MKYLLSILSVILLNSCTAGKLAEAKIVCLGGDYYKATDELGLRVNYDSRATVFEAKDMQTGVVYLVPRSVCVLFIE